MCLHLPIELLVRREGTPFQFAFATEAKDLLPEGEEFLLKGHLSATQPKGGSMSKYSRNSPRSDRWGAAIAGGILFALPMASALYRGALGWIDVVVAISLRGRAMTLACAMTSGIEESERLLDAAIECTFPASDPVAVHTAFEAACEREVLMISGR